MAILLERVLAPLEGLATGTPGFPVPFSPRGEGQGEGAGARSAPYREGIV